MPTVANGIDMDWAFSRAHAQNGEFELRHSFVPQRKGTQRLLFYANRAHMGTYREAVNAFSAGIDKTPDILLHEHFSALKYGFGYNTEQEITENLRVFGRFGWNEGQHESFAYTEVDQTVEAGADYAGTRWHRPVDKIGLAVVSNAIKRDHQNYLKLGGLGFPAGRRQPQLRPREHRRELLQLARLARTVLRPRRAAHRQPRLQPRPRPGLGGLRARARGFLETISGLNNYFSFYLLLVRPAGLLLSRLRLPARAARRSPRPAWRSAAFRALPARSHRGPT
jgi:hypothetical protein